METTANVPEGTALHLGENSMGPKRADQDRWSVYGARFGYDNRRCYFLVDYGRSHTDDHVPVLWYQWTGESLLEALRPSNVVV